MRTHLRPTRNLTFVTDPDTGRTFPVPAGGADDDGSGDGDGDGDSGGDGSGDGDGDGDSGGDDNGADGNQDDDGDDKAFSQADLDAAIDKRLARERKKHERELRQARRKAKTEGDGDEGDATAETQAKLTAATTRAVKAEARAAALAAGVPKDKAARFVSLADLDDVDSLLDDDGDIDAEAVESVIADTLEDWPEFAPTGDSGKGKQGASGAETHGGDGGSKKTWTRAEIAALSPAEFEEHQADIQEQVKRGLVK